MYRALANPLEDCLDAVSQRVVAKVRDAEDSLWGLKYMECEDFQLGLSPRQYGQTEIHRQNHPDAPDGDRAGGPGFGPRGTVRVEVS